MSKIYRLTCLLTEVLKTKMYTISFVTLSHGSVSNKGRVGTGDEAPNHFYLFSTEQEAIEALSNGYFRGVLSADGLSKGYCDVKLGILVNYFVEKLC